MELRPYCPQYPNDLGESSSKCARTGTRTPRTRAFAEPGTCEPSWFGRNRDEERAFEAERDWRHPHLHCLVPAGGLSPDGSRWVSCRPGFFLPVHVLGALFRGKYLALLRESHRQGKLVFHGKLRPLAQAGTFAALLRQARSRRWVVYAKPPFGGAEPALKYLARYTHRRRSWSRPRARTPQRRRVGGYRLEALGNSRYLQSLIAARQRR